MNRPTPKPQIVFKQSTQSLHEWHGRLLNSDALVDRTTGMPVGDARFNITEDPRTGRCSVLVQAASHHGRRWVWYPSVDAAQAGGIRWAARRFSFAEA